jgi:hypothetical protein
MLAGKLSFMVWLALGLSKLRVTLLELMLRGLRGEEPPLRGEFARPDMPVELGARLPH